MAKKAKFYDLLGKTIRAGKGSENVPEWLGRMARAESRTVSGCVNHIIRMYFLKGAGAAYLTQEERERHEKA